MRVKKIHFGTETALVVTFFADKPERCFAGQFGVCSAKFNEHDLLLAINGNRAKDIHKLFTWP
jgi:hypothetical protein